MLYSFLLILLLGFIVSSEAIFHKAYTVKIKKKIRHVVALLYKSIFEHVHFININVCMCNLKGLSYQMSMNIYTNLQ